MKYNLQAFIILYTGWAGELKAVVRNEAGWVDFLKMIPPKPIMKVALFHSNLSHPSRGGKWRLPPFGCFSYNRRTNCKNNGNFEAFPDMASQLHF